MRLDQRPGKLCGTKTLLSTLLVALMSGLGWTLPYDQWGIFSFPHVLQRHNLEELHGGLD